MCEYLGRYIGGETKTRPDKKFCVLRLETMDEQEKHSRR